MQIISYIAMYHTMLCDTRQKKTFSDYRGKRKLCFAQIICFITSSHWGLGACSGPMWPPMAPPNTLKKLISSKNGKILHKIYAKGQKISAVILYLSPYRFGSHFPNQGRNQPISQCKSSILLMPHSGPILSGRSPCIQTDV